MTTTALTEQLRARVVHTGKSQVGVATPDMKRQGDEDDDAVVTSNADAAVRLQSKSTELERCWSVSAG